MSNPLWLTKLLEDPAKNWPGWNPRSVRLTSETRYEDLYPMTEAESTIEKVRFGYRWTVREFIPFLGIDVKETRVEFDSGFCFRLKTARQRANTAMELLKANPGFTITLPGDRTNVYDRYDLEARSAYHPCRFIDSGKP